MVPVTNIVSKLLAVRSDLTVHSYPVSVCVLLLRDGSMALSPNFDEFNRADAVLTVVCDSKSKEVQQGTKLEVLNDEMEGLTMEQT